MIFIGKIAKYPVDYGLVQLGLDIRKTNRISIWVQPDFGFMNFILIWFAPVFLKPDRKLNRKYFGSRFNMVQPSQTWFNNIV